MNIYVGVVEDRDSEPDSFKLTRYRVRISGVHSPLLSELATEDLPWAVPIQPNSAAMSGIGHSATGYLPGSTVVVVFADDNKQIPLILGAIAGIPTTGDVEGASLLQDNIIPIMPAAVPTSPTDKYVGDLSFNDLTALSKYATSISYSTSVDALKEIYVQLASLQCVTINTPKEKLSGLLLASLIVDSVGTYDLLSGIGNPTDGLYTVLEMYKLGYKHSLGKATNEIPSLLNISNVASDSVEATANSAVYSSSGVGFKDPTGKWPKKEMIGESDVSRLARGDNLANGTVVGKKQGRRSTGIRIANSSKTWDQPNVPYSAIYPNNNVYESAAGHVLEFDDTPSAERVHLYHKSGSFLEIDNYGNKVDQTIASRTIVIGKDDLVYIKGNGHVTIDGALTLRVENAVNVEITGNANFKVGGDVRYEVKGEFSVNAKSILLTGAETVGVNAAVAPLVEQHTPDIATPSPINWTQVGSIEDEYTGEAGHPSASLPVSVEPDVIPEGIQASSLRKDTKSKPSKAAAAYGHLEFEPGTMIRKYKLPDKNATIDYNLRLSDNFTLRQVCVGKLGSTFPFSGQNGLTGVQLADNLQLLCANVLEPIKTEWFKRGWLWQLNSAIRPIGANPKSEHAYGMAADIGIGGSNNINRVLYYDAILWIRDNVPFSQLILEYAGPNVCWIHIAYNAEKIKKSDQKITTMYTKSGANSGTTISQGLYELAQGATHKS